MKRMDELDRVTKEDKKLGHNIINAIKSIIEEKYEEYANNINCKTTEEIENITFNFHRACLLAMSFIISSFIASYSSKHQETLDAVIVLMKGYIKEMRDKEDG
jgi:hypothetical protein